MSPDELDTILSYDGEVPQESFVGWSMAGRLLPASTFFDCDFSRSRYGAGTSLSKQSM